MRERTASQSASDDFRATKHAYNRARQRLGWPKSALENMMPTVFGRGVTRNSAKGELAKFIKKKWFENKRANNIRIYGEVVYLFHDNVLITMYQIDNCLKKYVSISQPTARNVQRPNVKRKSVPSALKTY